MRPAALALVVVLVLMAGLCVRMGLWQRSRWIEKRAANAELLAALAALPVALSEAGAIAGALGRRVEALGEFDRTRHVLLSRESPEGVMGVEVVTALHLSGGGDVLVDRGWIAADSAAAVTPSAFTPDGEQHVLALVQPLARHVSRLPWVQLAGEGGERWSTLSLDADTLAARWPGVSASALLLALPGGDDAPLSRAMPIPFDEQVHLSYAFQWALFTLTALAGAVFVLTRARKRAA